MLRFYKKSLITLICLLVLTGLVVLLCVTRAVTTHSLLPAEKSKIPWQLNATTDVEKGGTSSVVIHQENKIIDYEYVITNAVQYPHVTVHLTFDDLENVQTWADFSGYSALSFRVVCDPANLLFIRFHTFDPQVTQASNLASYRLAEATTTCNKEPKNVEVDLRYLDVPYWWLWMHDIEVSDRRYLLDKTLALSFLTSNLGPVDKTARVQVSQLELRGYNWFYIWLGIAVSGFALLGYAAWLIRFYLHSVIDQAGEKYRKDLPLMAYQQLTVDPAIDNEKSRILRYIATEYPDPELSLEIASSALGISRSTINEVLKEELGFTFSGYLNKIRLTEASRLLSETADANVAEIAHVVGYNNVSYFNKLFKTEYGCTPKAFKNAFKTKNLS